MYRTAVPVEKEPTMQFDGSNSARARSARIRASHDDEATVLESMRRQGGARSLRHASRVSLATRLGTIVGRRRRLPHEAASDASAVHARVD